MMSLRISFGIPRLRLFSTSKIPPKLIREAEEAMTEYLHSTRSFPFTYADHIARNSPLSLSSLLSRIPLHPSTFPNSLRRFLRYHPINEFHFFYESIGLHHHHMPPDSLFLSQHSRLFTVASTLANYGFPWNKLGMLCVDHLHIFSAGDVDFDARLSEIKDRYGFSNALVVGICLAFPRVLYGVAEAHELLSDFERVFVNHVKGNVDDAYEVCRKIKLFYDLGCKKGGIGGLLAMNYQVFVDCAEDDLVRKIDFFCRLGVDKEQVGLLLLSKPEILKFDLEDRVISVLSLLKHFNLSEENLKHVQQSYPYVFGKNRMVNLPHIIRAMDLSEWFFNRITIGDHSLLATYASSNQDENADDFYRNNFEDTLSGGSHVQKINKLDFLHGIGFGENKFTVEAMRKLRGTSPQLYERFNYLLSLGIKFSKLCKMISLSPNILNQNTDLLERKLKFLCNGMYASLEYLSKFPLYLMYDLENRIKPRYRFYMWLKAQGWWKKEYSFSTLIAMSEKKFIAHISDFHPDAPKTWLECQNVINEFECFPSSYRRQAIQHAQEAITDYLHTTRSLPVAYAEHIAKNASVSLSLIISQVPFQPSTFFSSLQRFLRYHPINEFEFFYESIGIDYKEIKARLPVDKFLSVDSRVFRAACALVDFGFPWNKLGMLCTRKFNIFCCEVSDWRIELSEFKDHYGFSNAVVVGICLAYPDVLSGFGESDKLLSDLKKVLLYTDLVNHVEGNVDATYEMCRKIKLFYELGCKKGEVGELLAMNHNIFIDYAEDDLVRKIDFFCKLGVNKEQVGLLLLLKPDILKFDLEHPVISVLSLLKHFNLSEENLKHIEQNYPYVLGKNRMVNVPHIIRAMDLSEWFFNTIKLGDHSLLATYASSNQGEDAADEYRNNLQKLLNHAHNTSKLTSKLDFLHGIGFGQNNLTVKAIPGLHGSGSKLYERFNHLLSLGIKFSKLCKMIRLTPQILNLNTDLVDRKVKFLCEEMDSSLEYLCQYPTYLMYDLENRIKPRFRFHMWLKAEGWCKKEYSVSNMISPSEQLFIVRISDIHPDAPKKWLEFRKERTKQVAEKSQST